MPRKKPVRHVVRTHRRKDGISVRSYERGSDVATLRRRRMVGSVKGEDRLRRLAEDLEETRLWGIDTEACHGEEGFISFSPGVSGGRIGPDLDYIGTLDELLQQIKPGGKIYNFLKANDYQTKITAIESRDLDSEEDRYLDLFGQVHKIEV